MRNQCFGVIRPFFLSYMVVYFMCPLQIAYPHIYSYNTDSFTIVTARNSYIGDTISTYTARKMPYICGLVLVIDFVGPAKIKDSYAGASPNDSPS